MTHEELLTKIYEMNRCKDDCAANLVDILWEIAKLHRPILDQDGRLNACNYCSDEPNYPCFEMQELMRLVE